MDDTSSLKGRCFCLTKTPDPNYHDLLCPVRSEGRIEHLTEEVKRLRRVEIHRNEAEREVHRLREIVIQHIGLAYLQDKDETTIS